MGSMTDSGLLTQAPSANVSDAYPSRVAATPARLERADPVLHGEWQPDSPLSEDQAGHYASNGFVVLDNVLDDEEVALLQAELARLLADPGSLDGETLIREPDSEAIRSIFAVHEQSALLGRLASDSRLVNLARFLLGDDVYVHQSRLNYKPGFTGREFYWHSDFETWHTEDGMPRMRAVSASILLSPNGEHNGPLMLVPGSHQTYVVCVGETPENHHQASLRKQEVGVPDDESLAALVHAGGIASVTGKPGSVVFFDCNTMHGSNGNITPLPRSNAFLVYNAWSNRLQAPFAAAKPRPGFIAARNVAAPVEPIEGRLMSGTSSIHAAQSEHIGGSE